jgi:hypothetical protein
MELETIRQINSITPQFPDSLRTILHSIGDLRTKNHALGQEVEQLKAGQLEPTTGPKPSAAAETPALTASNAQRSRFAHIFGSLFRRKQHGDDRGTAPNIHAPTSAESARDHIEVTELRYDGSDEPQTLLYAEGPALERIHFYRTRDRFVFTIWHFDPGRRRQILTGATAARSLPIILFARFMKVKPERSNVDFLQHIGMRGVLLHTEPFDHHSAEALRGRRIYGETLEYLTYNKDPNKLVGKVLDSLPIPEIVAMLAENNISVERAGNILAMTYAGFENETAKIRVKSQSTQRRNDLDAADERGDLRIYSISPTRTGGAVA